MSLTLFRLNSSSACYESSTARDLSVLQSKTALAIAKGTCRSRGRDKVNILEIIILKCRQGWCKRHTGRGMMMDETHRQELKCRCLVVFCTYNAKAVQGAEVGRIQGRAAVDVKGGKVSASSLVAGW